MPRKPNSACCLCGEPLYRRPSQLKKQKDGPFCKKCVSNLQSVAAKSKSDRQYLEYIERWKNGEESGARGKYCISRHVRRYLFEKYGSKCSRCGWGETNSYTGKIPLEVEHVDGDYTNNSEENLRLLCPNCHSLTKTYKGANRGSGRRSRSDRYRDGKSY